MHNNKKIWIWNLKSDYSQREMDECLWIEERSPYFEEIYIFQSREWFQSFFSQVCRCRPSKPHNLFEGTGQKVRVGGGPEYFEMWWLENTWPTPSNWSKTEWPTPKWKLKITWPTPYKTRHFWLNSQKKNHILWMKLWCYLRFTFIF